MWLSQELVLLYAVERLWGGERHGSLLVGVTPVRIPANAISNVMFADSETDINHMARIRSAKLSKPNLGSSYRTMTSAEIAGTDIGLSDIDAMIGQSAATGETGASEFSSRNLNVEMPPREELAAQEKFCQRSRFYPCQSRKFY